MEALVDPVTRGDPESPLRWTCKSAAQLAGALTAQGHPVSDVLLEDMEDIDPGLARERTVLAWSRTGLSFLALGGIVIRLDPLAGLAVLGLGALVWVLGYLHHRSMWTPAGARWLSRPTALRIIAGGTAFLALVALAIAFLGGGAPLL